MLLALLLRFWHDSDLRHVGHSCLRLEHLPDRIADLVQLLQPRVFNQLLYFLFVQLKFVAGIDRAVVPALFAVQSFIVLVICLDGGLDRDGVSIRVVPLVLLLSKVEIVLHRVRNISDQIHIC